VSTVRSVPFETSGWSSTGALFEGLMVDEELTPSLVIKEVELGLDWVALATDDTVGREAATWETSLLEALPSEVWSPTIGGVRSDDGYGVLMRNVSEWLIADDTHITQRQNELVIDGLASMHATYWMFPATAQSQHDLVTLRQFLTHASQRSVSILRDRLGEAAILDIIEDGWDALPSLIDPEVAHAMRSLANDPGPLVDALAGYPWTLLHTDVRPANVAVDASRLALFDWARPTIGPAAIDLMYWLLMSHSRLPISHAESIAMYRDSLRRHLGSAFSDDWWIPTRDISLLAIAIEAAPFKVFYETAFRQDTDSADASLGWWVNAAKPALRLLS
jgi:hypothetical protein